MIKINNYDRLIAYLALFSGLSISAVAVYYSVAGLVSIFAAAVVPIVIMGVVLEVGKLIATLWLKQNWFIAPRLVRSYLFSAVVLLMGITSMGIFGYLSKAHLDQAVPTGDVADKVALIDEKIQTQKDNIDTARKALQQMDASVDQVMARSTAESGAVRATQIRKSQAKERASLQADIATAQSAIAKLNEEKAPIAKELRKVEAEVGPIKYIAALIYGDNVNADALERAVRWVIILLVVIFDPLAVVLLLASQYSFQWFRKVNDENDSQIVQVVPETITKEVVDLDQINLELASAKEEIELDLDDVFTSGEMTDVRILVEEQPPSGTLTDPEIMDAAFKAAFFDIPEIQEEAAVEVTKETHPYLYKKGFWNKPEGLTSVGPQVYVPEENAETGEMTPELLAELKTAFPDYKWDNLERIEEVEDADALERPGDYILSVDNEAEEINTDEGSYIIKDQDKQIKMVYVQNSK